MRDVQTVAMTARYPLGEVQMIDSKTAPYAALVLRLAIGVMLIAHASLKIFVFTPAGTIKFFASLGLPEWFAYFIMAVEMLGGIALILGVLTRWVSLVIAAEFIGIIVTVQGAKGWLFSNPGGGWEFPAFVAAAALALALLGDGAYALWGSRSATS
jgi:putative oxidoreductase